MKWKILFLFIFTYLVGVAQKTIVSKVDEFIGTDIYENCYYLKNNTLHKTNLKNNYLSLAFGKPDTVDISNPLQILLLFKDFNTVVILDNQLNPIHQFNTPLGTTLIANAGQNKIWFYNKPLNYLGIFNHTTNKVETKSLPLKEPIVLLKGNLNQAYTSSKNNLTTFDFLANITDQTLTKNRQFPISLKKEIYIKQNSIYLNNQKSNTVLKNVMFFEVIHNQVYFFKDNSIQMINIDKN